MNLRDLKYIVTVAELRNFSQAADACYVSQPTLSSQIKKMEDFLGVKIFERTNKKVMPTEVGESIIQSARKILREVEVMEEVADSAHDPLAGRFRLGAFPTLATYVFPELIVKTKEALPNVRMILVEEKTAELIEQLRRGQLDAALIALPVYDDFFEVAELFEDEFQLAVANDHALAKRGAVSQDELSQYKLLLLEEGHCLRDQALEVCGLTGVAEEDFRATGLETLRQMVKAGTGITFIPNIAVKKDDGITYVPFEPPAPHRQIGLVWRKTSTRTEIIEKLTELLKR